MSHLRAAAEAADEVGDRGARSGRGGDGRTDNAHDWATRRHTPGSPLRDTRGSLGRARALRAAVRADQDLAIPP